MHQTKIPAALCLALTGVMAGFGVQADCGAPAALPAGQYAQVGLACEPTDPTVQGVFGDDLAPAEYGIDWVVYRYDPATNSNVLLNLTDPMSQDEGYWVWSRNAATWDVDGDPTPLIAGDPGVLCPSPAGCYPIPLTMPSGSDYYQWNMLGLPIPDTTAWADVRVVTDLGIYTPAEAQTAGILYDLFQRWNGSAYETGTSAGGDELNAHEGFYAATMASAAAARVPAVVPPAPPELWVPKPFTPGRLNDTGIGFGGNYPDGNNADCSGTEIDQQDCAHGRDAEAAAGTLVKVGGGAAGFDFTKLGADGTPLAIQDGTWSDTGNETDGTQWSCVLDHVTGLWWEVKTNDGGLRDKDWAYTFDGSGQYVADVNTAGLCGNADWRMPSIDELMTIRHLGTFNPTIDTAHFPNTGSHYWSASPEAARGTYAWYLYFYDGNVNASNRSSVFRVRLVRAGQ